jgi:hypothetical protein
MEAVESGADPLRNRFVTALSRLPSRLSAIVVYVRGKAQEYWHFVEQVCSSPGRRYQMDWVVGMGVIAGMFLLRLVVPVVITLALGHALHRLDVKWHPKPTKDP